MLTKVNINHRYLQYLRPNDVKWRIKIKIAGNGVTKEYRVIKVITIIAALLYKRTQKGKVCVSVVIDVVFGCSLHFI